MKYIKIFIIGFVLLFSLNSFSQLEYDNYFKGLANYNYKNYEEALIDFNNALSEIKDISCNIYIGNSYYNLNNYDQSISAYLEADIKKQYIADFYLARAYARKGDIENSIKYLNSHLNSKFKLSKSKIKLDNAFNNINDSDEWNNLWKNDWYNSMELTISEIEYLYNNENLIEALEAVDELLGKGKNNHKIFNLRAKILIALKDYKGASKDISKAIKTKSRNVDYIALRGEINYTLGRHKKALEDYNTALEIDPLRINLYHERAKVKYSLNMLNEALLDVQKYLKYFIYNDKALYLCGQIAFDNEDYNIALKAFNGAIKLNQSDVSYYISRAKTYYETKTYNYANKDFSMALDLNPQLGEVYLHRGLVRIAQDDTKGACLDWDKASRMQQPDANDYIMRYCR